MSLFTLRTRGDQQYGPVAMETLRLWVREGSVSCDDRIYDHTHDQWLEAGNVPQIKDLFHLEGSGASHPDEEISPQVQKNGHHPPQATTPHPTPTHSSTEKSAHKPHHKSRKTTKMLMPYPENKAHSHNEIHSLNPPPSVLARISRIFLLPFAKKKAHSCSHHHHNGKK